MDLDAPLMVRTDHAGHARGTLIFLALGSIQKSTSWAEHSGSAPYASHTQYNRDVDRVCVDRIPFEVTVEVRITRVPFEGSLLEILSQVSLQCIRDCRDLGGSSIVGHAEAHYPVDVQGMA